MDYLQELIESEVVRAIEENTSDMMELLSGYPKMELITSEEMIYSITDIPFPMFNSVLIPRFEKEGADIAIKKNIAIYKSRNVPTLWELGPNAKPDDLGKRLINNGFVSVGTSPGMAIDFRELNQNPPIPDGFIIQRVSDEKTLKIFLDILSIAFEIPEFVKQAMLEFFSYIGYDEKLPIQYYIGIFNDEPVATSMTILGSKVAGIYNIGTLPKVRRQGIGSIMTLIPLLAAKKIGYRVGVLTSSELGFTVYHKLGFREYCKINRYVWFPQSA